jgi:Ca2+-binding EF-hand superfamily protein
LKKPDFNPNDFSYYSREKLTNFKPPQTNTDLKIQNEELIHSLKYHFAKVQRPPKKNRQLFDYLDVGGMQKIRRKDFLNQIKKANYEKASSSELDGLFDFLDHNKTGFISLNEFRYYFYEREFLEKEVKENALNSALEDDLKELFRRIDADNSGYMDIDEFVTCLNLLGFVVTPDVIQYEFD